MRPNTLLIPVDLLQTLCDHARELRDMNAYRSGYPSGDAFLRDLDADIAQAHELLTGTDQLVATEHCAEPKCTNTCKAVVNATSYNFCCHLFKTAFWG